MPEETRRENKPGELELYQEQLLRTERREYRIMNRIYEDGIEGIIGQDVHDGYHKGVYRVSGVVKDFLSSSKDADAAKEALGKFRLAVGPAPKVKGQKGAGLDLVRYRHDFTIGHFAPFTKEEIQRQRRQKFINPIKFSILVPVYNTPKQLLLEMITSVLDQSYPYLELCIGDGSDAEHAYVERICRSLARRDERIRYAKIENTGISGNTNACLEMATGEWIALLDHDDLLHPSALFCMAERIRDTGAELIYTDECVFREIPQNAVYLYRKPDFAPDDLRATNYFCHFMSFDRRLLEEGEGLRSDFDGSQDHDLALRLSERTKHIEHIPEMLYWWRNFASSVSYGAGRESTVYMHGLAAVQSQLDRLKLNAKAELSRYGGYFRIRYEIKGEPLVSIVILNRDHVQTLRRCVTSILERTSWKRYEIIICENGSTEPETKAYYEEISQDPRVKICEWTGGTEFNYSALNNWAAAQSSGEHIVLLNNDTEVISRDWLTEMLMYSQRDDVGVVGALLLYGDGYIQHAGIVAQPGAFVGHIGLYEDPIGAGYMGRYVRVSDVSAVTGACMMVRRSVWEELGGLDESFRIAYNDVDLCLRARKAGYLVVFDPYAKLFHYEGKTRGMRRLEASDVERERSEEERFTKRHGAAGCRDPYYNRHFEADGHFREHVMSGDDAALKAILKPYQGFAVHLSPGVSKSRAVQLSRLADTVIAGEPEDADEVLYIMDASEIDRRTEPWTGADTEVDPYTGIEDMAEYLEKLDRGEAEAGAGIRKISGAPYVKALPGADMGAENEQTDGQPQTEASAAQTDAEAFPNTPPSEYKYALTYGELIFFVKGKMIRRHVRRSNTVCDISASNFISRGFQEIELGKIAWTGEKQSEIIIGLPKSGACIFTLNQGYSIPLDDLGLAAYPIALFVNGMPAATAVIDQTNNGKSVAFHVPEGLARAGMNRLTFAASTWSPSEHGGADTRRLGFSLCSITAEITG